MVPLRCRRVSCSWFRRGGLFWSPRFTLYSAGLRDLHEMCNAERPLGVASTYSPRGPGNGRELHHARGHDPRSTQRNSQMRLRPISVNQLFPLTLALCLTAPASAQIASFQHIILVVQENRTPDNMFQGLCTTPSACSNRPGPGQYNIQTTGWLDKTSPTGTTNPHANPLGLGYDLRHRHSAFVAMCDLNVYGACAMDGAANVQCMPNRQPCPTKPALGFVDNSTGAVQPYLDLVKAYGWGNYMFQTNQGPSFPAHQFLFGATSAPSANDDHNGIFVAENVG